jgi:hypothetical protein
MSLWVHFIFAACRSAPSPQLAAVAADPDDAASARDPAISTAPVAAPALPDLGERAQLFLVHRESREIALRSLSSDAMHVLVPHADGALYQPELELIWFRDGERFGVIDLRKPVEGPVMLARGMPSEDRFRIERGSERVRTSDGCDLPYVSLTWSEAPVLEAFLSEAPELRIEGGAWLAAELARPARAVGQDHALSGAKLKLPKKAAQCERPVACGASGAFGDGGKLLVLVREELGGDCIDRACLLYDPGTERFATPPKAEAWGAAQATAPGSCGPYLFDRTQRWFLVDHRLCSLEQGCRDVGGESLGWLVPGDSVGVPGSADMPE